MDLLKDYPLVVQFPKLQGQYLMLNWWSHEEQNHVSLAKTEQQIIQIYQRLLDDKSYYGAEPVNLYRINIVAPPLWLQLRCARRKMRSERRNFGQWLGDSLREMEPSIPAGFTRCSEYRPDERQGYDSSDASDEWNSTRHWGCRNCHNGYRFPIPLSQLFLKKRDIWLKIISSDIALGLRRASAGPSQAPMADPLKPLYAVQNRHGHHQDGTFLLEVGRPEDSGIHDDVKFFCHADQLPMIPELPKMLKDRDDAWEKERDANRAVDDLKNEAEWDRRMQEIRSVVEEIAKL
jgi:hypothetical protein